MEVEVELTQKHWLRSERIVRELAARYGSVWYFAADGPRRALERIAEQVGRRPRAGLGAAWEGEGVNNRQKASNTWSCLRSPMAAPGARGRFFAQPPARLGYDQQI